MQGFDQKMYATCYNVIKIMYRRPSRKRELIKRTFVYTAMTLLVAIIVTGLIFIILGYRIDTQSGQVERSALLQYNTTPTGASVSIDGSLLGSNTPTKSTVLAGSHKFVMQRDGYETWQKTLDIKAGTLTWLNYARLVPKVRPVAAVASYPTVHASLGTLDGQTIMVQQDAAVPQFQIVDVSNDTIKSTTITLPTTLYSDATTAGVTHSFKVDQWDSGGRYLLVEHAYAGKTEWLVVDTQDVASSKNITKSLDIGINYATFSGTSGDILYALTGTDIRKLDLSAGTISRSLVSRVSSFELYETNIITYVGTDQSTPANRVVGLYREGDSKSHILRTVTEPATVPLHVTTARYYNKDYIAITDGQKVDILYGSYPASGSEDSSSLSTFASFKFVADVQRVSFSPAGFYLVVQAGAQFAGYDIEHQTLTESSITGVTGGSSATLRWLDEAHLWTDVDGTLTMRDFDGANVFNINGVVSGYDATLTHNERYIYSIGKVGDNYQLQRVRMILP